MYIVKTEGVWTLSISPCKKKKKKKKKKNCTRRDSNHHPYPLLSDSEANSLPLRYIGTCWHKMEQNIYKLCSDTWPNVYSPPRFMNCWYSFYFVLCLMWGCVPAYEIFYFIFSILRWIYLRCEPYCLFINRILKKIFLCLIQVWLFLNLRLFDVISHFSPNRFVTNSRLSSLGVWKPEAPSIFRKKKHFGRWVTYTPTPIWNPKTPKVFCNLHLITSIIINPLHSRVAHRNFDSLLVCLFVCLLRRTTAFVIIYYL